MNISDGQVHAAAIDYAGGKVIVRLDGTEVLNISGIDLGLISKPAFVGIGGFTGESFENHDILSWSFSATSATAVPEPASILMLATGPLGLLVYGRCRRRKVTDA